LEIFTRIFVVESFLVNLRNITRKSGSISLSIPDSSIPFDTGNSPIWIKKIFFFRDFLIVKIYRKIMQMGINLVLKELH
jgi:hypothetical protein